ncbi:CLIP-associating protein 1-like isoform X3 [Dreissena polymorpha]|uniref:CLIP-associating protein 1-like isoform X3 n=1 Tax=Dreissena polymorpha TaxID=45954 RepID=UPI002263CCB3|nr:CLIP-associating protein 1-like isoform X3 [Dreissena polymorpha]
MATLTDFLPNVTTQDTKKRQQCYETLSRYLSDPRSSLECDDNDAFMTGLAAWVTCSNFKISMNGLEILSLIIDRMGEDFRNYVTTVLPAIVDRLGDSKDQVRELAQQVLLKLMMPASNPQYVFERMMNTFTHKLWHVREGVLLCLQQTINRYGARCLTLSKIVPSICKLLEDPTPQVREEAVNTLAEIYRHVGEKVRTDLSKKGISQQRLTQVFAKFDEVKMSGNMLATADLGPGRVERAEDEMDFARPSSTKVLKSKRAPSSASSVTSTGSLGRNSGVALTKSASTTASRLSFRRKSTEAAGSTAGAVDEDFFVRSFEDVNKVQIFSARDMTDQLNKCRDQLADTNVAWEKRVEALKTVRGVVIAGGAEYDDFYPFLRVLEPCFMNCIKDLRSQVVREACISVAYYAQRLANKFDHSAETLLPVLINLIPNSAKVMSTSGLTCIRFILQHTFASRLIPIITTNQTSKASIIRRVCFEFMNQVLHTWPTHILEKHIAILQEAIKKGISDADSEARSFARKSFWGFAEHFKDQADALLNHLDPAKQKALQGELSNSSSSNSINSGGEKAPMTAGRVRVRSASQDRGYESSTLGRVGSKSSHQRFRSVHSDTGGDLDNEDIDGNIEADLETFNDHSMGTQSNGMLRSNSAVDIAHGASSSAGNARRRSSSTLLASRLTNGSTQSLPRQKSRYDHVVSSYSQSRVSPHVDNSNRTRTNLRTSQSQPSSRSSSPTPRGSYLTHTTGHAAPLTPGRPRKSSTLSNPRSQGTSRETSPSRTSVKSSGYGRERRTSGSSSTTASAKPGVTGVTVVKTLKPGQDVEDLLADALRVPMRKRYESYDSDENASETSSVCSERSFSSYSKTSEPRTKDMGEILTLLQSSSYQDRKEGVISLTKLLRQNRTLTRIELKKATEIFTRMFHDPHSKVFSLFLDMLQDLITGHSRDMTDWLYVLLSRLLNKLGADILGSLQAKVQRALDATRECFPCDLQFNILTRFIIDQTQSPSLKTHGLAKGSVKLAMLNYLNSLVPCMDPSDFTNSSDTRLVVSRVITWTNEPKNTDVRKAAQSVLICLFNLNPPEFSMLLSGLPKAFQDGATKILQMHLKGGVGHEPDVLTPRNTASPQTTGQNRSRPPSRGPYGRDEADTENMNPEDIYNSFKKTTAEIQNLSFNSKLDNFDEVKKRKDFTSQDSGIQDLRNDSPDAGETKKTQAYNPSHYQEENMINGYNRSNQAEAFFAENDIAFNEEWTISPICFGRNLDQEELITEILRELSNHNERHEERKSTMLSLIKLTRENTFELWNDHFKSVLLILLETLGDDDLQVRSLALRVLREIVRNQAPRFKDYAELTMLRILDAHKDPAKDVVRAAEECAATLATFIPAPQSIRILVPIIQSAGMPINQAAIKMQTRVVEQMSAKDLEPLLPEIIPGLLKGYDDSESSVRKASVFCLVAVYMVVGEHLRNYLSDLNGSKIKLLNLYIKRAQAQKDSGKVLSPHLSDTS